jgi:protein-tyrosine phosphatase
MTMAEVFPDLWLGSLASLSDIATGISSGSHRQHWTVISILDSPKLVTFAESMLKDTVEQGRCYHVVWKLPDHPSAPFLSSELKSIVVQIDKVLLHSEGDNEASGACLVHCAKGVSRSVATVAAWYISRKNVSMAEALDRIRKNSQLEALPNMGFLASLRALEQSHGNIDRAIERMESRKQQMILDVVIIGSGPAGLVSAKTLLGEGITNIMVFEETSCAGGLWNREGGTTNSDSASVQPRVKVSCVIKNDKTGEAAMEIPASVQPVYDNLTSNFPKDMTSFIGYPFEPCIEHFPNAWDVFWSR